MPKFFLTTAIDFSNADPHVGHALEKIGADCIARYRRLRGDDVHFLMGMDEHSQSVIDAAARAHTTPQAWVDRMADAFAAYWRRLECSHDDWIRTSEPETVPSLNGRPIGARVAPIGGLVPPAPRAVSRCGPARRSPDRLCCTR